MPVIQVGKAFSALNRFATRTVTPVKDIAINLASAGVDSVGKDQNANNAQCCQDAFTELVKALSSVAASLDGQDFCVKRPSARRDVAGNTEVVVVLELADAK